MEGYWTKDGVRIGPFFRARGSSATGYKWMRRFTAEGDQGLHDRSSRPHRSPARFSPCREAAIVARRQATLEGPHRIGWVRDGEVPEHEAEPLPHPGLHLLEDRIGFAAVGTLVVAVLDERHRRTTCRRIRRAGPGELIHSTGQKGSPRPAFGQRNSALSGPSRRRSPVGGLSYRLCVRARRALSIGASAILLLGATIHHGSPALAVGSEQPRQGDVTPPTAGQPPTDVIRNVGQFPSAVRYQVRGATQTLWVTDHAMWLSSLQGSLPAASTVPDVVMPRSRRGAQVINLEMTYQGARTPSFQPGGLQSTRLNYFLTNGRHRWFRDVPVWSTLTLRWPHEGASITLTNGSSGLAMIVEVNPTVTSAPLGLRVRGATSIVRVGRGELVANSSRGQVALPQVIAGHTSCEIRTQGTAISFRPARQESVIRRPEPRSSGLGPSNGGLLYGSYLGGAGQDRVFDVAVGPDGATYLTGLTLSPNFPTTPGAFDVTLDDEDAFVTKLDPSGSSLAYSTFIGGTGPDSAHSLALGSGGQVYVGGHTGSTDFPTTPGAFQTIGGGDGFLTELNAQGDALLYSTYLGGPSGLDIVNDVALAGDGTLFATGETLSSDFPTTPGAYDPTSNGDDAFVSALNATGSALVYSTFLGGDQIDIGYSIAVGPDDTAFVAGQTASANFPTTPGAFDRTPNGGADVFVTRFRADGTGLIFSTYLGGSDNEDPGTEIALDGRRHVYVVGGTPSTDFPTTPGAYDRTQNSRLLSDAFLTKLPLTGTRLLYSTYLGGEDGDAASDVVVDRNGWATITGWTLSANFPTTPGGYDRTLGGPGDAFVARFDPRGRYLAYGSFLGGNSGVIEFGYGITAAAAGTVTVVGSVHASNFPTTPNAYDRTYNGSDDVFVATLQVGTGDSDHQR
jgi:hypothetical protein